MNLLTYLSALTILTINTANAQNAPVAVSCEQDVYALCAYANCTMNEDTLTANCPCYSISGPSLARIDLIPDDQVRQETIDTCTDSTSCADNNAPICDSIADGSLWPGADAVSTFSRELEVENGVILNDEGERETFTWKCAVSKREVRLVPNCMLAPCRALDNPVTNPYFDGEATMECTCPLIHANDDYTLFGGLKDPCDEPALVNVGGPTLNVHAMNKDAVRSAWEAVTREFNGENISLDASNDDRNTPTISFAKSSAGVLVLSESRSVPTVAGQMEVDGWGVQKASLNSSSSLTISATAIVMLTSSAFL